MKTRLVVFPLLITLLAFSQSSAWASAQTENAVVLQNGQDQYSLGHYMEILRDPSRELTIQDVSSAAYQDQFTPSQVDVPNFGFQKAAYWVRFRVSNQAEQNSAWVLTVDFANMHYVDLYVPSTDGAGYTVKQIGVMRPYANRDIPFHLQAFNLNIPPGTEQTIYLRFQSDASMTLGLTLRSSKSFTNYMLRDQLAFGLFSGAMIVMAIFNLLLWLLIRDRSYLYLVMFIFSQQLSMIVNEGVIYQYVQFNNPRLPASLQLIFFGLELFFILIFVSEVLDLRNRSPKLYRGSGFYGWLFIVTVLLGPFGPYRIIALSQLSLGIILVASIAVVTARFMWTGSRPARFLFISWIWFIITGIFYVFTRVGIMSSTQFSEHAPRIAMLWMVAVWSLSLADKVNTLKYEADNSNRQLRASELRLSQFLDAMPVSVVVFGADLKPQYMNQDIRRLLDSLPANFHPDFVSQKSLKEVNDIFSFRFSRSGEPYPLEQLPVVKAMQDGQNATTDDIEIALGDRRVPLEAWASPLISPEGEITGAVVAFRDIQERLHQETLLRESEERYRVTFENAAIGITHVSPAGRFIRVNQRFCEIVGYSQDEMLTLSFQDITHPDDLEEDRQLTKQLLEGEIESFSLEKRYLHKNGKNVWIKLTSSLLPDHSGEPSYIISVVEDITKRKLAEQALEASESRYRSLVETMAEGLGVADENSIYTFVNPRLAEMLGYTPDEMIGRPAFEFFDQENRAILANQLRIRRAGGQQPYTITWLRKDGSNLHTQVSPLAVFDEDGNYLGSNVVITDISEQVKASQLLDQRVAERTHEISSLLEVSQLVVSTLELEPLLQVILEQLKTVVNFSGAVIYSMPDHLLSTLHFPLRVEKEKAMRMAQTLMEELMHDERILHNEAIFIADLQADTEDARFFLRTSADFLDINASDMRSWMGVPLKVKNHLIGVLSVYHNQVDYYKSKDARLAMAFANQAAIAIENARLFRKAQVIAASEERGRLARDLHDSVTQALYSLSLYAGATRAALSAGKLEVADKNLDEVIAVAREGMGDLRLLIFELRPPILDEEGLINALQIRLESVERRAGIKTVFYTEGTPHLSPEIEKELYWSVHEALNNVLKHARAKNVTLVLQFRNGSATITLKDDGAGFNTSTLSRSNGMGLKNVSDRIEKLGGSLEIESKPGEGTVFRISLDY